MAAVSVYVLRVSSSFFLRLSKFIRWFDPGSFQIIASLLGPRSYEISCVLFRSGFSFPQLSGSPKSKPSGFQSQSSLVLSPDSGSPVWLAQCGTWTPYSLGKTATIVIILLFVGHPPEGMGLDYTTSLPFLPVFWFLLYIFSYGISFLLIFWSSSSIVVL